MFITNIFLLFQDAKDKEEKALQLENAILNLQILCLQSRQKEGEMNNIVDLMVSKFF